MSIHQNHSSNYTNSNMQYSNCKLTIPFTTSTSNKLVNINVCTSMCTWSTSTKHLESRTMPWFWWMFLATSTRTTKPIDQLQITQSACIHFNAHQKQRIHRKKHKTYGPHEGPDCRRLYTRQHEVVLVDGNFSIYQNHPSRSRETKVDYPRVNLFKNRSQPLWTKVVLVDGI